MESSKKKLYRKLKELGVVVLCCVLIVVFGNII